MTRRIAFVTGGAGFIGSNLAARLAEDRSLDVVVCDRLHEAELGKWRNIAKHPLGDFVAPDGIAHTVWRVPTADEPAPQKGWSAPPCCSSRRTHQAGRTLPCSCRAEP